jgi:hypothetical protein
LTNNRSSFKEACLNGKFDIIIGITFKALGINHFIQDTFTTVSNQDVIFFDGYWASFDKKMIAIFNKTSFQKKVRLLDDFFMGVRHSFDYERTYLFSSTIDTPK